MEHFIYQFPGVCGVYCLFCGRDAQADPLGGNVSWRAGADIKETRRARERVLELGAPYGLSGLAECYQVHGVNLLFEPAPESDPLAPQRLDQADGLASSQAGVGLLIKTADCQPVLLADATGAHIMALHVGWRGNRANFPKIAVEAFCRRYNLAPENLFAIRGPSLGPEAAEFVNFDEEWGPEYEPWFDVRQKRMNLWALTKDQLLKAGLSLDHLAGAPICTYVNHHAWFSYRRDHHAGRQAALIWIAGHSSEVAV